MKLAKKLFATYFIATLLFMACAWQADILNANLVYSVKDQLFEYWFHSWTKWTHYAWTFWGMALAFFMPLIVLSLHGLERVRQGKGNDSLKFDLDPSPKKAAVVCIVLFIVTVATGLQAITVTGEMPTEPQLLTIFLGAVGVSATYILGFLGYEQKKEPQ